MPSSLPNRILLSVIIPVYKVEKTLHRCVKSVLEQDLTAMEVILVDDGSPDGCPQMCDHWGKSDPRIRVLHQVNRGLSAARNSGLDIAQGAYITFVDSDDYIAPGTYTSLLEILQNHTVYDLLEYPVVVYEGNRQREKTLSFRFQAYRNAKEYWLDTRAYEHTYAWNKIYKRKLFQTIRFPVGRLFEDAHTLPLLLQQQPTVVTVPTGLYHYTWNDSGITQQANGQQLADLLEAYIKVLNGWSDMKNLSDLRIQRFYMQAVNIQMEIFQKGGTIFLPDLHKSLHLSTSLSFKSNLKLLIQKIFGLHILCWIYKLIKTNKVANH